MESAQHPFDTALTIVRHSHLLRLAGVGLLGLTLLVPIVMIGALVGEREDRRNAAAAEVSEKWGAEQHLFGPALLVPYTRRWQTVDSTGRTVARDETRMAVVLPSRLEANGQMQATIRTRGIFSVPVYGATVTLTGTFARASLGELGSDPASAQWEHAQLVVGLSDVRAIQSTPAATWNGSPVAFLPGASGLASLTSGIHAPVDAGTGPGAGRFEFAVPLHFNGSVGLYLAPVGENTVVTLGSNAVAPSFQGAPLPTRHEESANGFNATWAVPFLGRSYPQVWPSDGNMKEAVAASGFGVRLVEPIDQYRMAERSVKYAILFILFTFGTVWLMEVMVGLQVHPIQYLLLGAALCTFYLLELSLAEHLGFAAAYAIAATLVVALICAYGYAVLKRLTRTAVLGAGVAGLYGYLYVLLMNEDDALVIGSIGLFLVLAAVMFVTRNVNWYRSSVLPERDASRA